MLPKFNDIENSIGGRPKEESKVRLTYYLKREESIKLKNIAIQEDSTVSALVRKLIKELLEKY